MEMYVSVQKCIYGMVLYIMQSRVLLVLHVSELLVLCYVLVVCRLLVPLYFAYTVALVILLHQHQRRVCVFLITSSLCSNLCVYTHVEVQVTVFVYTVTAVHGLERAIPTP